MNRVPLTVRGAEQLRKELHELKSVKRPQVIEAIATARAHGDLRENAEYHAAREQQSFIEGRIREIEGKLSNAEIVDVSRLDAGGRVTFGATVVLADGNTGEEFIYTIVGEDEADIKQRLVSVSSPIARAMIGKEEGEIITVEAPAGHREYEIVEVSYGVGET
ncbi:MAG: transcription elongation factor GreA [Gammaproteobacteria bacterium]|nr:transcription elongation factor GreA [Gammaproteobacteria bacterium]MDE0411381.1 transcription elongation factor GreA [Gammaproteobacteria bacterium]